MPFPKGDPRAAAAGRRGQHIRWSRSTREQRQAANATMLAAQRAKYVQRAEQSIKRLGIKATPEQVEQSATALQRADRRDRMALARDTKAELRSQADAWVSRVHGLCESFIDGLVRELGLTPDMATTAARVAYGAMADETDRPQDERNWQRLRHRWEDLCAFCVTFVRGRQS